MYLPCARTAEARRIYRLTLQWTQKWLNDLPARCLRLILTDANTRLGTIPSTDQWGTTLIGTMGAQQETSMSPTFRGFVESTGSQVVNSVHAPGSGPTWAGAHNITSRIDYVLTSAALASAVTWVHVG